MIDSIDRILQQYEISHYGFLPVEEPLSSLPHSYYQPWENLIAQLPELIRDGRFYHEIASLPVLDTERLHSIPEWRRAYVILTFFTHAHIWSASTPHEILPPSIAVPLLTVSTYLGLPPTATYPALNLWNCGLTSDTADITNPENVIMRHTFTGTPDEAWFYAVSVSVEARGVAAIQTMLECVAAIHAHNDDKILECLTSFGAIVIELGHILQRMHEHCDPQIFYHRIRPFLAGSRGMEKAGLPRGIFYDEGEGKGSWRQYSGGSNAQSTLVQFLDIALGVRHEATGTLRTSHKPDTANPTTLQPQSQPQSQSHCQPQPQRTPNPYLTEMRAYMPLSHRLFLEHFTTIANIRSHATSQRATPQVTAAFNTSVDALTAFRDIHIRIVGRYIVAPSRMGQSGNVGVEGKEVEVKEVERVVNIASASAEEGRESLKGTGGTDLMGFLKRTRDETREARGEICTY